MTQDNLPTNNPTLITGIDDATKCPVIGSIFIAGVTADQATIELWKEKGVKDSKLIAPKKREQLAHLIKETATAFTLRHIKPSMIDNKAFNLNDWEMLTVFKIVNDLHMKTAAIGQVFVDNWEVTDKVFFERLTKLTSLGMKETLCAQKMYIKRTKMRHVHFIPEHRADENHIIVGAASILAKTASDLQYKRLKKRYGNFGSGNPGDPKTRFYVWKHRLNPPPIIRTSWNTFKTLSQINSIEEDWLYIARKTKSNSRVIK